MKINWRNLYYGASFIGVILLAALFFSTTMLERDKKRYWKKEAETARLDARTWELRYQGCNQRNQKLEYHLIQILTISTNEE